MFGLPIEAVSMLASTLMGGLMKLWGNNRADLAEERKWQGKTAEQIEAQKVELEKEKGITIKSAATFC